MKNIKCNWGEVFASRMEEKGITVYKLAQATGLPKMTLYRTVRGERDGLITKREFELITNFLKIKL